MKQLDTQNRTEWPTLISQISDIFENKRILAAYVNIRLRL
jgi:hypothetical protein